MSEHLSHVWEVVEAVLKEVLNKDVIETEDFMRVRLEKSGTTSTRLASGAYMLYELVMLVDGDEVGYLREIWDVKTGNLRLHFVPANDRL